MGHLQKLDYFTMLFEVSVSSLPGQKDIVENENEVLLRESIG
jgi:hypothetical protein